MSDKNKDSLSLFMKKQMSEKSTKNNLGKKSEAKNSSAKEKKDKNDKDKKDANQEEMTEEEELEEAKKASRNKAAQTDQTDMIKKLILENIVKYTVMISVLVIFSIGLIKFGPGLLSMLNGLLYKILMGALGK